MRDNGYIYIAYSEQSRLYKVGTSIDPRCRINTLCTGDPSIILLSSYPTHDMPLIERLVHQRLRPLRVYKEWFRLSPAMLSWLEDLLTGKPVEAPPLHLEWRDSVVSRCEGQ